MSRLLWYPGHELLRHDIVRAEKEYVWDSQGRRYVDLESGVWCTSIGHGHPRILRVLADQAGRIAHTGFNYASPVAEETASEVLDLLGFEGGRCVFLCSGSEAVEYGVRLAQSVSDRPLLLTLADSYFGAYGSASRKEESEWFCFDWFTCDRCRGSLECPSCREAWAAIPFDRIGGFLFEPGSSSGLVRFPPDELIQRIVRAIREAGGLILVNEVTTGIGRTGAWFGYQHYRIDPDIVAIGKGIGNGYPVSVTAFSSRTIERLGGRPVRYAQSHQNDPLGAAVAREVLHVIAEENLLQRCRDASAMLLSGLGAIRDRTARVREVRGRGLMVAIELVDDEDAASTVSVHRALLDRGFLVGKRPGAPVLRCDPTLCVSDEEIESFIQNLEEILGQEK